MIELKRLFHFVLVTLLILCLVNSSRAIGGTDELSSKIDNDIFLDDEGSGRRPGSDDLESSGSGGGIDDEDWAKGRDDGKPKGTSIDPSYDNNFGHGSTTGQGQGTIGQGKKEDTPDIFPIEDNSPKPIPPDTNDIGNNNIIDEKPSQTSFFSQPGILAAIICGCIVGLLCAILLVMFIVYRMRKKDEGSYVLDDSKRGGTSTTYGKSKEFFA